MLPPLLEVLDSAWECTGLMSVCQLVGPAPEAIYGVSAKSQKQLNLGHVQERLERLGLREPGMDEIIESLFKMINN